MKYLHEGVLQQTNHGSFQLDTASHVVVEVDTVWEAKIGLEFFFDQIYCKPVLSN